MTVTTALIPRYRVWHYRLAGENRHGEPNGGTLAGDEPRSKADTVAFLERRHGAGSVVAVRPVGEPA